MDPEFISIGILSRIEQDVVDRDGAGHSHKAQVAGQQFLLGDGVGGIPLVPCPVVEGDAKRRLIDPFRE